MKVVNTAFDRNNVQDLRPYPKAVLISITAVNNDHPPLDDGWDDILYLKFDDVKDSDEGQLMTIEQGAEVIDFVIKNIDCAIFVNCDAGLRRSPAVIFALEHIFNKYTIDELLDRHPTYRYYNKWVFHQILDAWHKRLWLGDIDADI